MSNVLSVHLQIPRGQAWLNLAGQFLSSLIKDPWASCFLIFLERLSCIHFLTKLYSDFGDHKGAHVCERDWNRPRPNETPCLCQ